MAIQSNSEISIVQQLLNEVGEISHNYRQLYDNTEDIKALQGMERCAELYMKICGIDGKQHIELVPTADSSISLADLPDDLLQQIGNHINKLKMQQQHN